jgi:hypothetical protein
VGGGGGVLEKFTQRQFLVSLQWPILRQIRKEKMILVHHRGRGVWSARTLESCAFVCIALLSIMCLHVDRLSDFSNFRRNHSRLRLCVQNVFLNLRVETYIHKALWWEGG